MLNEKVERFRESIRPYLDDWQSIDIRVIAHRSKEGYWLFSTVYAVLDSTPPSAPTRGDLPSLDGLLVAHERWSMDRLDTLLSSISNGKLSVGKETVHIERFVGQNWRPSDLSFNFYERNRCKDEFRLDSGSFVLSSWESDSMGHDEVEKIDRRLRLAYPPWDGLADLRQNFTGLQGWKAREQQYFSILAPLGVRIRQAELDEEKVRLVIERNAQVTHEGISISIIAHLPDGSIERVKLPIHRDDTVIPLQRPTKIILILSYKDEVVERIEKFGKPSALGSPEILVMDDLIGLDGFATSLRESRGKNLEVAASLLFGMLGFSAANYGMMTGNLPDILAFSRTDGSVLVIECTAGEPDLANKLTKLATRSKGISRILERAQVLPVMVTALDRMMINTTDKEKAAKEEIAIVTKDEIRILIQMALNGASAKEVHQYLFGLVPSLNLV